MRAGRPNTPRASTRACFLPNRSAVRRRRISWLHAVRAEARPLRHELLWHAGTRLPSCRPTRLAVGGCQPKLEEPTVTLASLALD